MAVVSAHSQRLERQRRTKDGDVDLRDRRDSYRRCCEREEHVGRSRAD